MNKHFVILKHRYNKLIYVKIDVLDAISVITSNHVTNEIPFRGATIPNLKKVPRRQLGLRNRVRGDFTIALRRNDPSPQKFSTSYKG